MRRWLPTRTAAAALLLLIALAAALMRADYLAYRRATRPPDQQHPQPQRSDPAPPGGLTP